MGKGSRSLLIVLPSHLRVSGVTTWAMRAIDALRSRGIDSGLLVHAHPQQRVPQFLESSIERVIECDRPIEQLADSIDRLAQEYGRVVGAMHARTNEQVLVVPCLHGDCFGAVAELTRSMPDIVRPIAWVHADNQYDLSVAAYYESVAYAFGCVSSELAEQTAARMPARSADVFRVPNPVGDFRGVDRKEDPSTRPIRLVYTGRLDEQQKRVSALLWIARTLDELGIPYEMRVVGDGDSMDELRAHTASIQQIQLLGSVDPDEVQTHLHWSDLWVLPSRYEGQSVAMLEAMACGCVPMVTRVRSGMNESIVHGRTGFIVDVDEDATGETAGREMGRSIARALNHDLLAMSSNAMEHIDREHSSRVFADHLVEIVEHVRAMPRRAWSSDRPCVFRGSTPIDAHERMRRVLDELADARIAIYGAGRHTADLSELIARSSARIVCVIDDESTRWGSRIAGFEIVSLDDAAEMDIEDVVISSWMHEERLLERLLKRLPNARAHRLYGGSPTRSSTRELA